MAENKKSFVLYCDLIKSIGHLTNEEKGILFNHILEYVNDKNPILEDRLIYTAWLPIELQLKRDLVKWSNETKDRSDAGKKGMANRWAEHNKTKQSITKDNTVINRITNITDNVTVNDTVNVTDTVNDNVIKKEKEIFSKFNPHQILKNDFFIDEILINDFLQVRKNKKAPLTQTAWAGIVNECTKHNFNISDALKICCENNWIGFRYDWYLNKSKNLNGNGITNNTAESYKERTARELDAIFEKRYGNTAN